MLSCLIAMVATRSLLKEGFVLPKLTDTVVYEENLRAEGPKVGFNTLVSRLDSIHALGVNVIWLMPVQPVGKLRSAGGLGSPYAMANFSEVNPEFGTEADFQKLVDAAHSRKMAVIIDWVANHSAWDNPWITLHPNWYRHDSSGAIISPPNTNWKDVAQFDLSNGQMRKAMIDAMQGWVDKFQIDGFRCDSAEFVPTDFWRQAVTSLRQHSKRRLLMLAEGWNPELCQSGFDLAYGWHFCDRVREIALGRKASDLAASVAEESAGMPSGKLRLRFITNHDKYAWDGSPTEQYKAEPPIKLAFDLEALDGGVPLIYSGQEVNWPTRIPIFGHTTIDWASNPGMRSAIASVLRLRAKHEVLRSGSVEDLSTNDTVILHRILNDSEALILANPRPFEVRGDVPGALHGTWTESDSLNHAMSLKEYKLPPYSFQIYFRGKTSQTANR